jgi:hypothetical protein
MLWAAAQSASIPSLPPTRILPRLISFGSTSHGLQSMFIDDHLRVD